MNWLIACYFCCVVRVLRIVVRLLELTVPRLVVISTVFIDQLLPSTPATYAPKSQRPRASRLADQFSGVLKSWIHQAGSIRVSLAAELKLHQRRKARLQAATLDSVQVYGGSKIMRPKWRPKVKERKSGYGKTRAMTTKICEQGSTSISWSRSSFKPIAFLHRHHLPRRTFHITDKNGSFREAFHISVPGANELNNSIPGMAEPVPASSSAKLAAGTNFKKRKMWNNSPTTSPVQAYVGPVSKLFRRSLVMFLFDFIETLGSLWAWTRSATTRRKKAKNTVGQATGQVPSHA